MRPLILHLAFVGAVIREMIFRRVDFPAPFSSDESQLFFLPQSRKKRPLSAQKSPFSSGSGSKGRLLRPRAVCLVSTIGEDRQAVAAGIVHLADKA